MTQTNLLQRGIFHLISSQRHPALKLGEVQAMAAPFDTHPFGLDTRLGVDRLKAGIDLVCEDVFVLAHPGCADTSVRHMTTIVQSFIAEDGHSLLYLRKITHGSEEHGYVYFEVGANLGVYMCGGCVSDCRGPTCATEKLDGLFTLIATALQIPYEDIVLKCADEELAHRRFIRDFECIRKQAA